MPAKAKLTDAQVKRIRRQVRAGALQSELAVDYGVNRKTIRRRLDALERTAAERTRSAEQRRLQRLERRAEAAARSEQARPLGAPEAAARSVQRDDGGPAAAVTVRGRRADGRMLRREREFSYTDWLDERDARRLAPPEQRVRLVTASGKTVGRTGASNAEHMSATLEPRYGPLTVLPV
jgi:hypothetical protein